MKRTIDLAQTFTTFEGDEFKNADRNNEPLTLRDVLLSYLRSASHMGLTNKEMLDAKSAGHAVGASKGEIEVTSDQYKALMKLANEHKMKMNGEIIDIYSRIEVTAGLIELLSNAKVIDEPKSNVPATE